LFGNTSSAAPGASIFGQAAASQQPAATTGFFGQLQQPQTNHGSPGGGIFGAPATAAVASPAPFGGTGTSGAAIFGTPGQGAGSTGAFGTGSGAVTGQSLFGQGSADLFGGGGQSDLFGSGQSAAPFGAKSLFGVQVMDRSHHCNLKRKYSFPVFAGTFTVIISKIELRIHLSR
jgi:hypothetical protein